MKPHESIAILPSAAAEQHTFVFADLAGFTALTEAHGDVSAADLAEDFIGACRRLLEDHRAREVKTIGDALMLVGSDPGAAVRLGLELVHGVGERHGVPSVRVGMHTGAAVERGGDFYGSAVNVAARVAGIAGGGQVLLSEATKAAAADSDDVELRALGSRTFKNVSAPLAIFEAVWRSSRPSGKVLPIDPVCRMTVEPAREAGRLVHAGVEYHFCSLECAAKFAAAPDRYLE